MESSCKLYYFLAVRFIPSAIHLFDAMKQIIIEIV